MRIATARRRNPVGVGELLAQYWPYLAGAGAVGVGAAIYLAASKPTTATANLGIFAAGRILRPGQYIYSQNGQYALVMQTDGNLVVYKNPTPNQSGVWTGQALWGSGNDGHQGAIAAMQGDGDLVMYDAGASVSTAGAISGSVLRGKATGHHDLPSGTNNTPGGPGAFAVMQNDGNFVVYAAGATVAPTGVVTGNPLWSTDTSQGGSGSPPSGGGGGSNPLQQAQNAATQGQNLYNQGQNAATQGQDLLNQATGGGSPSPDTSGGSPSPDTSGGSPSPDTSGGSPSPDTSGGSPSPDTSGGS